MTGTAEFSIDRLYRYRLTRRWQDGEEILWVMLNPSVAEADIDDPTVRKCIGFSRRWGYGGLMIVNLYALRATKQADLWASDNPTGLENLDVLRDEVALHQSIVLAWGDPPSRMSHRAGYVYDLLWAAGKSVFVVGLTKSGFPRHPSRAPYLDAPWLWTPGSAELKRIEPAAKAG